MKSKFQKSANTKKLNKLERENLKLDKKALKKIKGGEDIIQIIIDEMTNG